MAKTSAVCVICKIIYRATASLSTSVLTPAHVERRRRRPGTPLLVPKGASIAKFWNCSLTLDFGLRRTFRWIFNVTSVDYPIVGSDFVCFLKLMVDVRHRRLEEQTTNLSANCRVSQAFSMGIVHLLPASYYRNTLGKFRNSSRSSMTALTTFLSPDLRSSSVHIDPPVIVGRLHIKNLTIPWSFVR